jgi:hypothetical protein
VLARDDPPSGRPQLQLGPGGFATFQRTVDDVTAIVEGDSVVFEDAEHIGTSLLAVPSDYSGFFYPLPSDSTHGFSPSSLALGPIVSGLPSVLVDVKHPIAHRLGDSLSVPIGWSRMFRLSQGTYTKLATDRRSLRLSGIAYDPMSGITYAAERDSIAEPFGATLAESTGTLLRVDATGHVDTMVWNPPTISRLHYDPVRRDLLIAAPNNRKVFRMDSVGTFSVYLDSLSLPVGMSRGQTGWSSGWTAVAEYVVSDTSFAEDQDFFGRITLRSPSGTISRIPVTTNRQIQDCAFGPGGPFGANLYISVADSVVLPETVIPGTGKIMVMSPGGSLTDFATGLEDPDALVFDPDGKLYVAVPGGVVRIAHETATPVPQGNLPRTLAIRGPMPNPVRNQAWIELDLPTRGRVTIDVLDVAGRLMWTATRNEDLRPGTHRRSLEFAHLPPGVYAYRVKIQTGAGIETSTRRVTVLR